MYDCIDKSLSSYHMVKYQIFVIIITHYPPLNNTELWPKMSQSLFITNISLRIIIQFAEIKGIAVQIKPIDCQFKAITHSTNKDVVAIHCLSSFDQSAAF